MGNTSNELEKLFLKSILTHNWDVYLYQYGDLSSGVEKILKHGYFEIFVPDDLRGDIKLCLIDMGIPVQDQAGYQAGESLTIKIKDSVNLRPYQVDAVNHFYQNGSNTGGSGVLSLPCGSGKTLIAMACMQAVGLKTLVIVPNITAARQWKAELLDKTNLSEDQIGEYSGLVKELKPITICTYQILTSAKGKNALKAGRVNHLEIISKEPWGFVICDEVHLLPAPLFKLVVNVQSRRRLGLTATLVREDGKEHHVFGLIGPKKYDIPWKILEEQGWVAKARCVEVRVGNSAVLKQMEFAKAVDAFRIASENEDKLRAVEVLLEQHSSDSILIIGMYISQLEKLSEYFNIPILDGRTNQKQRDDLYRKYRSGIIKQLIVSKVANNAVDLPDASVAIQVSGMFGSRQEEAQRLGRILRPKKDKKAVFYNVITEESPEELFAVKRQLFLVEQGYQYEILRM